MRTKGLQLPGNIPARKKMLRKYQRMIAYLAKFFKKSYAHFRDTVSYKAVEIRQPKMHVASTPSARASGERLAHKLNLCEYCFAT